jgi:hypothetical protein
MSVNALAIRHRCQVIRNHPMNIFQAVSFDHGVILIQYFSVTLMNYVLCEISLHGIFSWQFW